MDLNKKNIKTTKTIFSNGQRLSERELSPTTLDKIRQHIESSNSDNVNHPAHYADKEIEVIDYIRDTLTPEQYEGYCIGNVIKYVSRYRKKGGTEDLAKGETYLRWAKEACANNNSEAGKPLSSLTIGEMLTGMAAALCCLCRVFEVNSTCEGCPYLKYRVKSKRPETKNILCGICKNTPAKCSMCNDLSQFQMGKIPEE